MMTLLHPDLFGGDTVIAASSVATGGRREMASAHEIRAMIDRLRGDAPIRSVGVGRLSRELGGGKTRLLEARDAYAAECAELPAAGVAAGTDDAAGPVLWLSVAQVARHSANPRIVPAHDPTIAALADSIVAEGQLIPVCVVVDPDIADRYLVLDGYRRLCAIRMLVERGMVLEIEATLVRSGDAYAFITGHWAAQRNWSAYERAVFFVAAAACGNVSQAALARKAGLTAGGFTKAMDPARLPDCIYEAISDRRDIRVSDANRLLSGWKTHAPAISEAIAALQRPAPARIVMQAALRACDATPQSGDQLSKTAKLQNFARRARAVLTVIEGDALPRAAAFEMLRALVTEIAASGDEY